MLTFRQDGEPSHRSKHAVFFLQTNVPDFIEPANWPSGSPDLNSSDHSIWNVVQQLVHGQKTKDIDQLKQVLNSCWDMIIDQPRTVIDKWSERLLLVLFLNVVSHGGHIEHHFP